MILILPGKYAWQSGEGIKSNENSSNKTAMQQTHQQFRLGEHHTFDHPFYCDPFCPSLPTSHPFEYKQKTTILPRIMRYLYLPKASYLSSF